MKQNKSIVRSQKAIQAAFLNLMIQTKFEEISTTSIIDLSGYSRGTFYAHYTSKYDLAEKIMENEITNYVESIAGTIRKRKRIIIEQGIYEPAYRLFIHVNENQILYKLILESKMPEYTLDTFIDAVNIRFKQELDVETSKWPEGLDRDFHFYVNSYTFMIYIKYWEMHSFSQTAKYMAEQVTYMLNRGKADSVFTKEIP